MDVSDTNLVDVSGQARKAGIEVPVMLDPSLVNNLRPSPYLSSLGITLEGRIENLLSLVNGSLCLRDTESAPAENRFYIPFMIIRGPLVSVTQAAHDDTGCR
ncbi:MAG: hypothetical protein LBH26_08520 [Treponema sp.]|jgi:hypothetical protein|nr:hypothetical protein [Treponema sp.]